MDDFKGEAVPHLQLAEGAGRPGGKRVGVIGTGATGIQVIGEIADKVGELTVFQRRPNWCAPLNNAPDLRGGDGRHPGPLRRDLRHVPRTPGGFVHEPDRRGFWRSPARSGWRCGTGCTTSPGSASGCQLPRDLHGRGGQRRVLRVHRRPHPPAGERPGRRREADPEGPRLRRAAGAAGDPLLRGLQPRQRPSGRPAARRPIERITRPGIQHHRRTSTSSTSSSTPPASTRSPAPTTASTSGASTASGCATSGRTGPPPISGMMIDGFPNLIMSPARKAAPRPPTSRAASRPASTG